MYREKNLSLLNSCNLTSGAATRTLFTEATFKKSLRIFMYINCMAWQVKSVNPFCQWMGHCCVLFVLFFRSSLSFFSFFFLDYLVSEDTKRNRWPRKIHLPTLLIQIFLHSYEIPLLKGPRGYFQVWNRRHPSSFNHPGCAWQCHKEWMVGRSAREPRYLSICGAPVWSSWGYNSMHRREDLQPVCNHQGHHPWVFLSNFSDWPRAWHQGLHLLVPRHGAHDQHGHQDQSRRLNIPTVYHFPGPFQLPGAHYIHSILNYFKVYIHDKNFFLINDNPYGLPSLDRRLHRVAKCQFFT